MATGQNNDRNSAWADITHKPDLQVSNSLKRGREMWIAMSRGVSMMMLIYLASRMLASL